MYREFHLENTQSTALQLVIPDSLRPSVLTAAHNEVSGGHLGSQRTREKIRTRFYWPFMSSDVDVHCSTCSVCSARKPPTPHPRAPMSLDRASYPMQRVAIDLLGPLPTTAAGNRYIAVVVDYFTKWTEAFPLPDIRTTTVASAFVDGFVCRYGVPDVLHSDQGGQFTSTLFVSICQLLDLGKTRTTPYRPQSDGLVERMNRTLEQMLSAHIKDHHNDWDLYLQRCLRWRTGQVYIQPLKKHPPSSCLGVSCDYPLT